MTATERILESFNALSPVLQAAARFVVDHPNEVVISSMRTVAERAGAQPATLVRLAQRLGYDGWPALKYAFAEDLNLHGERYGPRARNLTRRGGKAELLTELFNVQRDNIARTEAAAVTTLRDAARLLKRARSVHIAGFRASSSIAYSLFYGYRLFRNSVSLIDGHNGGLEMQLRQIERNDALIVVTFSPYSRESMAAVEAARDAGAAVIAMTDSAASPAALGADVVVQYWIESPSFFPSTVAAQAVAEALLEVLVAEADDAAVQRIDRAEQQLFDSGAYLSPVQGKAP